MVTFCGRSNFTGRTLFSTSRIRWDFGWTSFGLPLQKYNDSSLSGLWPHTLCDPQRSWRVGTSLFLSSFWPCIVLLPVGGRDCRSTFLIFHPPHDTAKAGTQQRGDLRCISSGILAVTHNRNCPFPTFPLKQGTALSSVRHNCVILTGARHERSKRSSLSEHPHDQIARLRSGMGGQKYFWCDAATSAV